MAEQFLGEIRIVAFNFAPSGWALCNGQTLAINQNQALFALLGTTFGGNGVTNFMLPNLQGNVVLGAGTSPESGTTFGVGEVAGEGAHTLSLAETPPHTHAVNAASGSGSSTAPVAGSAFAADGSAHPTKTFGSAATPGPAMAANLIQNGGSSQPHENHMPFLVLNFAIAMTGIFPSRN